MILFSKENKVKKKKNPYINVLLKDVGYKKIKHLIVPEIICAPSLNH